MAIATVIEDSAAPQVILAVLQAQQSAVSDLEKQIKSKEFVILMKNTLELPQEQKQAWFPDVSESEGAQEGVEYIGYVLQRRNAEKAWKDLTAEINSAACGICDCHDPQLRDFFPSAVLDQYLLEPLATTEYLNTMRPTLMDGIQQLCEEKPEDPVQRLADWLQNHSKTEISNAELNDE